MIGFWDVGIHDDRQSRDDAITVRPFLIVCCLLVLTMLALAEQESRLCISQP